MAAIALGAALFAAPLYAGAAGEGGTVCGRVDASPSYIFQLAQSPAHDNVIVARSGSEVVQTTVNVDGSFCFKDLHTDLHTLIAFESAFPSYHRSVTPEAGRTLTVLIER